MMNWLYNMYWSFNNYLESIGHTCVSCLLFGGLFFFIAGVGLTVMMTRNSQIEEGNDPEPVEVVSYVWHGRKHGRR